MHVPTLALLLPVLAAAAAQQLPFLNIALTPSFEGAKINGLDVRFTIQRPNVGANRSFVSLTLGGAEGSTQLYDGSAIEASDASGKVSISHSDNDESGNRDYIVARSTSGDVVLKYTAKPNLQPGKGEFLDFRAKGDGAGAMGPGLAFIPIPAEEDYNINVSWDLSQAPKGTRGVWTFGEGAATQVGPPSLIHQTLFAVGQIQSYPPQGTSSNYSMYWFGQSPANLNLTDGAIWTEKLFSRMSQFFRDEGGTYRVFARKFPSGQPTGAVALKRSFMFPYSQNDTFRFVEEILAHEMVHNWALITDDTGNGTWYTEGIADFYSARLPYRFGMYTLDRLAEQMNKEARMYYENPLINISLDELAKMPPELSDLTILLPYVRGHLFLTRMDTEIRAKSNGTRSMDDIVQAMLDRTRSGQRDTLEDLLNLMVQELGPQARQEYKDMVNGKLQEMPENSLGLCFSVEKIQIPVRPRKEAATAATIGGPTAAPSTAVAYQWRKKPGVSEDACTV